MFHRNFAVMAIIILLCSGVASAEEEKAIPATLTVEVKLCTGVEEREPIGETDKFSADVEKIYLWSRVTGAAKPTIIRHVWLHEGKEVADVELTIKGSPWRTWSYKSIPPEWTGNWEVKVVGPDGNVIRAVPFTVGAGVSPKVTPVKEPTEAEPADSMKSDSLKKD